MCFVISMKRLQAHAARVPYHARLVSFGLFRYTNSRVADSYIIRNPLSFEMDSGLLNILICIRLLVVRWRQWCKANFGLCINMHESYIHIGLGVIYYLVIVKKRIEYGTSMCHR